MPFEASHGDVRQLISTTFDGHDVVQVGGKIIVTRGIRHFPVFLDLYLQQLLRPQWMAEQMRLPPAEQNPVVQWRNICAAAERQDEGEMVRIRTGAGRAWFRLAYDLYLMESNAKLQEELVDRIRTRKQFQGARFEAAVAAMMLPAGYDLVSIPARGGPEKRGEYIATHRTTGRRLIVEAKSKERHGIMGFPGDREEPEQLKVWRHLHNAIEKDPVDPLLIFVELNVPRVVRTGEDPAQVFAEAGRAWQYQLGKTWPGGLPAVGVVFYNDACPWYLPERLPDSVADVAAFHYSADRHRHSFDATPLLQQIVEGSYLRLNIPKDYPNR